MGSGASTQSVINSNINYIDTNITQLVCQIEEESNFYEYLDTEMKKILNLYENTPESKKVIDVLNKINNVYTKKRAWGLIKNLGNINLCTKLRKVTEHYYLDIIITTEPTQHNINMLTFNNVILNSNKCYILNFWYGRVELLENVNISQVKI